jgi:hypothetical protein
LLVITPRTAQSENYLHERAVWSILGLVHPREEGFDLDPFEDVPSHVYKRPKTQQKAVIENVIQKPTTQKPRMSLVKRQKPTPLKTLEEEIEDAIESVINRNKPQRQVIEHVVEGPKLRHSPMRSFAHETWAIPADREEEISYLPEEDYQRYADLKNKQRQPYKSSVYKKVFNPKSSPVTRESRDNMKNVLLNQFELTTALNNQLSELKKKSNSPKKMNPFPRV